jgi:hypothetical protein
MGDPGIFPFKNGEEVEIKIKKRKEVIITRPKLSESIVDKYFGIWKNNKDIPDSKEYVRAIRKGKVWILSSQRTGFLRYVGRDFNQVKIPTIFKKFNEFFRQFFVAIFDRFRQNFGKGQYRRKSG